MHPSTALATVLVDEWVRCGVRDVVLSPGSRSAPLAYAVQQAERAGRLRLHVRVDERSAGFLALGLAKVSRRPAVVVTTSGTAVANLHPAVLEAHHAGVPVIVCSADRPAELRGTGANQTTVQPGVFAGAVRFTHDQPPAEGRAGEQASWRSVCCRAHAAATGVFGDAGPVHLNVAFREPLAPSERPDPPGTGWPESLAGRPGGAPWVRLGPKPQGAPLTGPWPAPDAGAGHGHPEASCPGDWPRRTLVVLGDLPDPALALPVLEAAARCGWPVVAEPWGTSDRRGVLPHGPLLLTDQAFLSDHVPDLVLTVGRITLAREVAAYLRGQEIRVEQVSATARWTDPSHVVRAVHPLSRLLSATCQPDPAWAAAWRRAGAELARRVGPLIPRDLPTGPAVAAAVRAALQDGDTLVVGSSNPPRDLDLVDDASPRGVRTVVGNRGVAGIDGTLATAVGIALTAPCHTFALTGDLTFLHDLNGLLIGPGERRPDLTVVVVNDDGGGIFSTLEHGSPGRAGDFERIFGTATGADLGALCRGYGVTHRRVPGIPALMSALSEGPDGISVLEVPVDRTGHRAQRAALRAAARSEADRP